MMTHMPVSLLHCIVASSNRSWRQTYADYSVETKYKLEVQSVEHIYLRQRCFDASKRRVAAWMGAHYQYVGFSRRNKIPRCSAYDSKPRVAAATRAQYGFSRRKWNSALQCIRYRRKQSGSGIQTMIRIGLKSWSVRPCPNTVDTQNVIKIHARVFE